MPGIFQAVIQATGEVAAYKFTVLLGSLKQDTLVKSQLRVLQSGPVHTKLMKPKKQFQQRVLREVGKRHCCINGRLPFGFRSPGIYDG